MDAKDRQIIRALQRDGRMTNQELAERVNLSPSPCLRRLRKLEASGAIRGFTVDADPVAYGLPITAFVHIRLERHTEDTVRRFERQVAGLEQVLECHVLTGGTDYLLKVVVADLTAYETFVREGIHPIGGVGSIDTSFVYGTTKRTAVFPTLDR
ncbi:Lrp/AsnC family transcriptional regulator [Rhodobacteraceae bacterium CCMM004]|nr:Lrp/AsnC family transcriptional regulator [Rhodobacteraceae bacterium CCMM004]